MQIFLSVDLLVWGVLLLVCWLFRDKNPWLLTALGLPATAVVWLSCRVKTKKPVPAPPPEAEADGSGRPADSGDSSPSA